MANDKRRQTEPRPRAVVKITMLKRAMRGNTGGRLSRQLTRRLAGRGLRAA